MDESLISARVVPMRAARAPTYFTYYMSVLVCLADQPTIRLREVAVQIGLTERAVTQLVADLVSAGVIKRHREGRRNRYEVIRAHGVPAPMGANVTVGAVLALLGR